MGLYIKVVVWCDVLTIQFVNPGTQLHIVKQNAQTKYVWALASNF